MSLKVRLSTFSPILTTLSAPDAGTTAMATSSAERRRMTRNLAFRGAGFQPARMDKLKTCPTSAGNQPLYGLALLEQFLQCGVELLLPERVEFHALDDGIVPLP